LNDLQTVDNPVTEEDTNKVASEDNKVPTVNKVDPTVEEMLLTELVNPEVVRLFFLSLINVHLLEEY